MSQPSRANVAARVTNLAGTGPVAWGWRRARAGLRVIAYHDVPSASTFAAHLDLLRSRYSFVSGAEVVRARRTGRALPADAVWITFDDGDLSVVERAAATLAARDIVATMFVCPGLIDGASLPWWEVVAVAGRLGRGASVGGERLVGSDLVGALKLVPDGQRREIVDALADSETFRLAERPAVMSRDDLRSWVDSGHEIGNHTWDHPCLDRCTPEEQTHQIEAAHDWIQREFNPAELLFAYPNGNRTDHSLEVLQRLGYDSPLLFDHRINGAGWHRGGSSELSRLRLDADAPRSRVNAIVSGAHSDLFRLIGG